jgi:uncharacterized cupin superfamily protein
MTSYKQYIAHHLLIPISDTEDSAQDSFIKVFDANFSKHFDIQRLGIHHVILPAGKRASYPHAESHEEEFVYSRHMDEWPRLSGQAW